MILWLPSYPKNGNTFLRSLLSAYFFSETGSFNFDLLRNIKGFPDNGLFKKLGIDINNQNKVLENYIYVQRKINESNKKSIRFIKTHSILQDINGSKFTDLNNTLGAIYVVRDPRNVAVSFANHFQITIQEAINNLIAFKTLSGKLNTITHIGSWSAHYNSWKALNNIGKYLLVKYEDLISDTEQTFLKILNFIAKISNSKFTIDKSRLDLVIKTTSFESLKKFEQQLGFKEAGKDKNNQPIIFFKYGPQNKWKQHLNQDQEALIIKSFLKEMTELNYI